MRASIRPSALKALERVGSDMPGRSRSDLPGAHESRLTKPEQPIAEVLRRGSAPSEAA